MIRTASSVLCAGVLALTCCALSATAQTTGPSKTGGTGKTGNPTQQVQGLNEQTMPQFLRNMGYTPVEQTAPNGARFWSFSVQQDGWNFAVNISLIKSKEGQVTGYWLVCPLGNPLPSNVSAAQLQRLLQENANSAPCFFVLHGSQISMVLELPGAQLTPDLLRGDLSCLFTQIRRTQQAWDASQWNMSGQTAGSGSSTATPK